MSRATPLVSCVIPTHDRGPLVGRAIDSVLAQTWPDFELIVVDDGSNDGTADIVRRYADARLRFLRLDARRGVAHARNVAVDGARGEWIAFLDDDDEWLPPKLERQLARLTEPRTPPATVAYCRCYAHDDRSQRRVLEATAVYEGDVLDRLLTPWCPPTPSLFVVKRAALAAVGGFDETLPSRADWDLWLRLAQAANRFVAVDEPLVVKHENVGDQMSSDPALRERGFEGVDRKWGAVIRARLGRAAYRRFRRESFANIQYAYGMQVRSAVESGARARALRACLAMCRYLPWSRKYLLHGIVLAVLGRHGSAVLARGRRATAGGGLGG